jgi:hypothetical protein
MSLAFGTETLEEGMDAVAADDDRSMKVVQAMGEDEDPGDTRDNFHTAQDYVMDEMQEAAAVEAAAEAAVVAVAVASQVQRQHLNRSTQIANPLQRWWLSECLRRYNIGTRPST